VSSTTITCRLCHSANYDIIKNTLRYGVKRRVLYCQQCGLVYLEPKGTTSTEYYSGEDYRQTYGPNLKKVADCREIFETYLPFQNEIIKEIEPILRADMRVLDVGCSTGHFLAALKGLVGVRVGMEFNQNEVEFIKTNLDFPVYTEPLEKAVIQEGPFDLVTALQVVEHIEDPLSFLHDLGKNIKLDGYLYLELPNIHDIMLDGYHIAGYEEFYYREPHVSYFSEKTLGQLVDQAGFQGTIKTVQRYTFMNHLHWLLTGKPQDNFTVGNADPILITDDDVPVTLREDFNAFIKQADKDYKYLIEKHGLGESLTFLGKKKI